MRGIWVARLSISDATRAKVAGRHGIDVDDLRAHLVGRTRLAYRWSDHAERGRRAVIDLTLRGHRVAVVLYPAPELGEDCWRLGSAYPLR
jgi:hypothetical protein